VTDESACYEGKVSSEDMKGWNMNNVSGTEVQHGIQQNAHGAEDPKNKNL
jgi:hypothetical protein